jgi:hypothetical protein
MPVQLRVSPGLRLAEFRLRPISRQGSFGLSLQRHVLGQIGLGLLKTRLKRPRIDGEEQIALLYVGAVDEVCIRNSPGYLRPNLDYFTRDAFADLIQIYRHILCHRRRNCYRRRRPVERHLLLLPASRAQNGRYGHQCQRSAFLRVYFHLVSFLLDKSLFQGAPRATFFDPVSGIERKRSYTIAPDILCHISEKNVGLSSRFH